MEKPQILSPCSSGSSSSSVPNSPEFEFWILRNPSFPQPNLSSADELFSGGVLLPLHPSNDPPPPPPPPQHHEASGSGQLSVSEPDPPTIDTWTTSKRWIDIFKKDDHNNKEKNNRKKKKNSSSGSVVAAEFNIINIWPFSRSKSAGNGGARPRAAAPAARKVSSAPCSRSNSTARKWPNSPSRGGVHLGRSSPVWQVRRGGGGGRNSEPIFKKDGNEGRRKKPATAPELGGGSKGRLLSLNVPMCIGYRHNMSCRSDENSALASAASSAAVGGVGGCGEIGGAVSSGGVRRSHLFSIRSLFTKKVY